MKLHSLTVSRVAAVIAGAALIAFIVVMFLDLSLAVRLTLGVIAIGLAATSLALSLATRRLQYEEEKYERLMARLDAIHETLKSIEEKPQKQGIAVADIFGSGMQWYKDYLSRAKGEQEQDPDA